ncbi:hypothetical protein ACJJTC_005723 [Scirpophaga incertulas]
MDELYALGVTNIQIVQEWFIEYEDYFELLNNVSNPHYVMEYLFPAISIFDAVFGAQLLLCMAFGGWLNAVMKWWLLEDRPYWWVRETTYYTNATRPYLYQTWQTCETGPGSPSGHSMTMAMVLLLFIIWIAHIMNDIKQYVWWWKYMVFPSFGVVLSAVMLARLFVATHFPHQVLLGGLIGSFLAPALCIYVSDPFIWRFRPNRSDGEVMFWHVASAVITGLISLVTYGSLVLCGVDPLWTIKLAFRWCENPEDIQVTTTPMYALVNSTASLLGWALCVTPAVAMYRHYTGNRSLLIATLANALLFCIYRRLEENINKDKAVEFYALHFLLSTVRPALFLRLVPFIAMWPYEKPKKQ